MICRNCGNPDAYQGFFGDPECPILTCKYYTKRRFDEILTEIGEELAAEPKKTLSDEEVTVIKNPYFMNPNWQP